MANNKKEFPCRFIHGLQRALDSNKFNFQAQLNPTAIQNFYWGTFLRRKGTGHSIHTVIFFFYNHSNRLAVFAFPDRYYPSLEDQLAFVNGAIEQKLFSQAEKLKLAFSMNLSLLGSEINQVR